MPDIPAPANKPSRRKFSKLMRRTHMFFALFLTPWVLMYALSTMAMQHREALTGNEKRTAPEYVTLETIDYQPDFPSDATKEQAAEIILKHLDQEGMYSVKGNLANGKLEINRDRPIHALRITYEAGPGTLTVEQQEFGLAYTLEMLHRRRGFNPDFWVNNLWAVVVDVVIVAIIAWALTGLWMWWETKPTRKLGAVFLAIGATLFAFFLAQL